MGDRMYHPQHLWFVLMKEGEVDNLVRMDSFVPHTVRVYTSMVYAIAAAAFYRKSFNTAILPSILLLIGQGLLSDAIFSQSPFFILVMVPITMTICYQMKDFLNSRHLFIQTILYFMVIMDARMPFYVVNVPFWVRIPSLVVPQFLRRPLWLKHKLQSVRSNLGPVYVFYLILFSSNFPIFSLSGLIALTAGMLGLMAGVFFRPDNSALLKLLYPDTTFISRRQIHKKFMILSFILAVSAITFSSMNL